MHKHIILERIITLIIFFITIFLYFYILPNLVWAEPNEGLGTKTAILEDTKDIHNNNLRERMTRRSINGSTGIGFDDLAYLKIPYYDFSGNVKQDGEMVVNKNIADEVLLIFQDLYNIRYPIDKMTLIDEYYPAEGAENGNSADYASIEANNTSAFNERPTDSGSRSYHALGQAIDINPIINPYIFYSDDRGYYSTHSASAGYVNDRISMSGWSDVAKRACINTNSEIYRIFTSRGWKWLGEVVEDGSNHIEYKDTQHFQKEDMTGSERIDNSNSEEINNSDSQKKSMGQQFGEIIRELWDAFLVFLENFFTGRNETSIIYSLGDLEPGNRVLFIGNSRTNVNNVPMLFTNLSQSLDQNVEVDSVLEDAQKLSDFMDKEELLTRLNEKSSSSWWDYLVLQEQTETAMNSEIVTTSTGRLIDFFKDRGHNITPIYKAWGVYRDFNETQYNQATQSFENAKSQHGGNIAYIGKAFLKCHQEYPEIVLYYDDRHATMEGSYLATCCVYAAIFDEATEGATFISTCSQDTALKLQKIADEVMGVTGRRGQRGSSEVVNYATSWVGRVHYSLRSFRRTCRWICIRLFMVCLSCNESFWFDEQLG